MIGSVNLDPAVSSFVAGIVLLQLLGFQHSAYISGEIDRPSRCSASMATPTNPAASAGTGTTLCVNAGSKANHGVLRGYLVGLTADGVERSLRVER